MGIETKIKRLFVLMLENRSFDNLLGWSDLHGVDPTGAPTQADTLVGKPDYTNTAHDPQTNIDVPYPIAKGAPFQLQYDPGHEFSDVLVQLCHGNLTGLQGNCVEDSLMLQNGVYPQMVADPNQLGFAECLQQHNYDVASALSCFTPDQLPVINFLASQFAVCDRWFASMPGPTLPNRFFALAGTSWGIDYSPSDLAVILSSFFGDKFGDGNSIYTSLDLDEWLVAYGDTPLSWSIKRVYANDHRFVHQSDFFGNMLHGDLDESAKFIFIEPFYSPTDDFKAGESMHPLGDVRHGEALIKEVYEAFLGSKYWEDSALLITFDEHGGLFDHVIPDPAVIPFPQLPPSEATGTKHGFRFDRYGVRVPAIIVSPYVRQGTIDHTVYDHLSIVKTLQEIARPDGAPPLFNTARFQGANSFSGVFTLDQGRSADQIPGCPDPHA